MKNEIIRCPRCGSTAQVSFTWDYTSQTGKQYIKEYECRCGCVFETVYEIKEVNILEVH